MTWFKEHIRELVAFGAGVMVAGVMVVALPAGAAPVQVATTNGAFPLSCTLVGSHVSCSGDLPTASPTPPPTTAPPTTAPPTTAPPTTPPPTTQPPTGFPGASNTGVPAGTILTAYTGPCTIKVPDTVIDARSINCKQLIIATHGVIITRSWVTGTADPVISVSGGDLNISDSTISAAVNTTGLGDNNWTGTRLNISGGNRGANCDNHCTLKKSWLHGNRVSGTTHASGLRAGQFTTADGNTLNCDAPADNCSADLTGYPDFAPTMHWTITNNLFVAQHHGGGYFCAYGGNSSGPANDRKPFWGDPTNATYIQFQGNTFQRGASFTVNGTVVKGKCGGYSDSSPFADYDKNKVGFVFDQNHYDDGTLINA